MKFWGWFGLLLLCLMILFGAYGCASPRYFTEAEDAEIRAKCEQTGCAVIQLPILQQLLQRLQGQAI